MLMEMATEPLTEDHRAALPPAQLATVQRACRHIEARIADGEGGVVTLAELGRHCRMSPWHLQRLFKQVMGVTPRQYGDAKRLERLRAGLQQIPRAKIGSPVHPELAGATVCHRVDGLPAAKLESELWTKKWVRVRSQGDLVGVRQSCQIYNNEAEIDATLEIVRNLAAHA